ncbi:transcription-repair coupling factor [Thermithiobacillus plumbiphilus]|uniref:Transcription-repair-coupling factor n=1 Tax=Thermithiobacillus plumbiphilus TaxID=1729899 RepID=A0ABU9DAS2_9PROT
MNDTSSALQLPPAPAAGQRVLLGGMHGSAAALVIAQVALAWQRPLLVIARSAIELRQLETELRFFGAGSEDLPILAFPDREILPYDLFSPPADLTAQRLAALYAMPGMQRGIILTVLSAAAQVLPPRSFLDQRAFVLAKGDVLKPEAFRLRLVNAGYRQVSQVSEAGEIAWRGGILDIFPPGSSAPYRVDLFDDEVDSIRRFDPETQISSGSVERVELLPAREVPHDEAGIQQFRGAFRAAFAGDPQRCTIYRDVSNGIIPAGIESYLPLFFEETATLFDYLPDNSSVVLHDDWHQHYEGLWAEWQRRFEDRQHDKLRPVLAPGSLTLPMKRFFDCVEKRSRLALAEQQESLLGEPDRRLPFASPPELGVTHGQDPLGHLIAWLDSLPETARVLIAAESRGRREALQESLRVRLHAARPAENWQDFVHSEARLALTTAPLERGLLQLDPGHGKAELAIVSEAQLFGNRVFAQRRQRSQQKRNLDTVIRDLGELSVDDPVVHEDYGIGRFKGLAMPFADRGDANEYVMLQYAEQDILYLPIAALDRLSRYIGNASETPPLSKLGNDNWSKAKARARAKAIDAAAELLDIHARRAARQGQVFPGADDAYWDFVSGFPFEETPDQQAAIDAVISDMVSPNPMDRLIVGDVGFGKTEVALRAAFIAVNGGAQVALLVPTTLLAQQHFENFRDRFADSGVRVELLSRFRSAKEQKAVLEDLARGTVDIVIGTHRLLQKDVKFKQLGLLILDEEHRFGVRQKERVKELRAEVDILTLTATPIPRTLSMSLAGLRDLSIISTPPERRLPVKTAVTVWDDTLVREAVLREIHRGGQVYFLHNEVQSIERMAKTLGILVPEASVRIAHGQMSENELESVMLDFYHQRFNVLMSTTIIESGIDNPHANTILINRADKLGLAQLHQLRGRVGRSHQRAYAYLITPEPAAISADAKKRLEAIQSLEELGIGFALASQDLEIRGAGEILGEEQSGRIDEVGFALYSELLNEAVEAIRAGRDPHTLSDSKGSGPEVNLNIPALIPADYLPDINLRLQMYKRIAQARDMDTLHELRVEMIDRFGLLPEPVKSLFCQAEIKLECMALGVQKLDAGPAGGRIQFLPQPKVKPETVIRLIQSKSSVFRLEGQDKLRITQALPDGLARCEAIQRHLDQLKD